MGGGCFVFDLIFSLVSVSVSRPKRLSKADNLDVFYANCRDKYQRLELKHVDDSGEFGAIEFR